MTQPTQQPPQPLSDEQLTQILRNIEKVRPGTLTSLALKLDEAVVVVLLELALTRNPNAPLALGEVIGAVNAAMACVEKARKP